MQDVSLLFKSFCTSLCQQADKRREHNPNDSGPFLLELHPNNVQQKLQTIIESLNLSTFGLYIKMVVKIQMDTPDQVLLLYNRKQRMTGGKGISK